jgi:hypothetical protein
VGLSVFTIERLWRLSFLLIGNRSLNSIGAQGREEARQKQRQNRRLQDIHQANHEGSGLGVDSDDADRLKLHRTSTRQRLPSGRLVVSASKHLTAVIDEVIHNTHDPSRRETRCVYGYWQCGDTTDLHQ